MTGSILPLLPPEAGDALPEQPLSVSELTAAIRQTLEARFRRVYVVGEVSNLSRPRSGHVYFTLKDAEAQIRAVLWRPVAARLTFALEDGLELVIVGRLSVYPRHGDYQIVVDRAFPKGLGVLELAFRQRCEKLRREGLFDPARKRPLPLLPRRIGIVTSPTGAALQDMLRIIDRRFPRVEILIAPVRVQGPGAAEEIAAAIHRLNRVPEVDVMIVGRGGGSLEDLWAFNEEVVARAIFHSAIPVISAVGHEIDVTISDLVADCRAKTPSEAAELVVPLWDDVVANLRQLGARLAGALQRIAASYRARVDLLAASRVLRFPDEWLHERARRLDDLMAQAVRSLAGRLLTARHRLEALAGLLESLSPLAVLARGYSITLRADTGRVVRDASQVHPGQEILTRLHRGRLRSTVGETQTDPPAGAVDSSGQAPSGPAG